MYRVTAQEQEDIVKEIMADYAGQDIPFTSLDITIAANKKAYIPNRTVRELVKKLITNIDELKEYTTSSIEVTLDDGSTARAVLYHHYNYNPDDYLERSRSLKEAHANNDQMAEPKIKFFVQDLKDSKDPDITTTSKDTSANDKKYVKPSMKVQDVGNVSQFSGTKLDDDASAMSSVNKLLNNLGNIGTSPTTTNDQDDILNFGKK